MKVVYEDNDIKVSETGRDYDFIAVVEEKASGQWVGILANDEGYAELERYKMLAR